SWSSATLFGRFMAVSGWAFVNLHHWRTPAALSRSIRHSSRDAALLLQPDTTLSQRPKELHQ
ncbi:MAG: hypothetical protein WCA06_03360, partial [Terrimicrobiaceae bacterium]